MVKVELLLVFLIAAVAAHSVVGLHFRRFGAGSITVLRINHAGRDAFGCLLNSRKVYSSTRMSATGVSIEVDEEKKLGNPKGVFNAVGVSSKFFVSGMATIVLYGTDSWVPLYYILASVMNGVLSKCLKKIIKEPRPPQSDKGGYGMPSSHTQAFFFFLAVVTHNSYRFLSSKLSVLLSLSLLLYSCVASYWRVVAGVHSFAQTVVGAAIGLAFGAIVATNEASAISRILPYTGGSTGVPIYVKLVISTLAAIVICKSEPKLPLKFVLKKDKKK